jgi:Domain of unknown function (DUF5658)
VIRKCPTIGSMIDSAGYFAVRNATTGTISMRKNFKLLLKQINNYNTPKGFAKIIIAVIILNLLDWILTMYAISQGATEKNPIFAKLFDAGQWELATLIKLSFPILLFLTYYARCYQEKLNKPNNFLTYSLFYSLVALFMFYVNVVISNTYVLMTMYLSNTISIILSLIISISVGVYIGKKITE